MIISVLRWLITSLSILTLTACGSDGSQEVSSLLLKDDLSVCAHEDAIEVALTAADQKYSSYLQGGGEPIIVDAISATKLDKDIHEVTCSAVLSYHMGSDGNTYSKTFKYKLRPTLDGDSSNFVAEVTNIRNASSAIMWQRAWWESQQQEARTSKDQLGETSDPSQNSSVPEASDNGKISLADLDGSDQTGAYDPAKIEVNPPSDGKCRIKVGSTTLVDGTCKVTLDTDGSFQVSSTDSKYFAKLLRYEGEAKGYWNGSPYSTHAQDELGTMTRFGACWRSPKGEICAWAN